MYRLLLALLLSSLPLTAADSAEIRQAADLVRQRTARTPKSLALEFCLLAAQVLKPQHPGLALEFPGEPAAPASAPRVTSPETTAIQTKLRRMRDLPSDE